MAILKSNIETVINQYVREIKNIIGEDYENALIYGSFARGENSKDSDIDIAIFTSRKPEEFYLLINEISEITFEYNVKYDIILSPVFQNISDFNRMVKFVPYYQSIQREGISIG